LRFQRLFCDSRRFYGGNFNLYHAIFANVCFR
jgi:hypothetical protein